MDIIKNLNYSANEINDILASVSAKASDADLTVVKTDLNNLTTLFQDYAAEKTTLADYGITDAKIKDGTITLGANQITPVTSSDLQALRTELLDLIVQLQKALDISNAPDKALVDSEGNVFILKDGESFITK